MDFPMDIMHLLHNDPFEEGPSKWDKQNEKCRLSSRGILALFIFINLIMLELSRKYLNLWSIQGSFESISSTSMPDGNLNYNVLLDATVKVIIS
ncbi:hypothetical protein CK203_088052 [Vitis vinifera]|uniref:Uncharacterized protein n=1 Tax=Vitis vinifera TaxID=29760 RepID=A0A438DBU8_VITVI|nr:hypothetical protein CK203_088052 [Vitis vinifera]